MFNNSTLAKSLANQAVTTGGGTVWWGNGKHESGFVVALAGWEMTIPDIDEALEQLIISYMLFVAAPEAEGVGIWHNDGKYYLDSVVWVENEEAAIQLGCDNGQLAIYDITNATVIDL